MTAYIVTASILFVLGAGMDLAEKEPKLGPICVRLAFASWGFWLVLR